MRKPLLCLPALTLALTTLTPATPAVTAAVLVQTGLRADVYMQDPRGGRTGGKAADVSSLRADVYMQDPRGTGTRNGAQPVGG